MDIMTNKRERMQDNLKLLLMSLGWTQAELARRLDVSRQHITNISNKKSNLTAIHYLAIKELYVEELNKYVFKFRLAMPVAMMTLIECPEITDSEEEMEGIIKLIRLYAPAVMIAKDKKEIININLDFLDELSRKGYARFKMAVFTL